MPHLPFSETAHWIWSAEGSHAAPAAAEASPSHYQVRYFRREFEVLGAGSSLAVSVSADSRFLLYCNGRLVARGPAKGDVAHHFYENHDLSAALRPGWNVLAALVLDMSRVAHRPSGLGAPCSVMTYAGGFLLEGFLRDSSGRVVDDLCTNESWQVRADAAHGFQNEGSRFEGYHGYFEHRQSRLIPKDWNLPGGEASGWKPAQKLYLAERRENRRDPKSPYGLIERSIPALFDGEPEMFSACFGEGGADAGGDWERLRKRSGIVPVPPRTALRVVLDAGRLVTGFPGLEVRGEGGAVLSLTYAEALRLPWNSPGARLLGRQQALGNLASHYSDESTGWTFDRRGRISGWRDIWEPGPGADRFEPLHWRAFRFVGLDIRTDSSPLEIGGLWFRLCAYPYQVKGGFSCSDPTLERIFNTALETMRLCSHETFEDCPHYEQMQYAGDTMITSKIAMLSSGDYALTRQALLHFDWSRIPEGLTQSRYPSRLLQVIPSWSLHWITAIKDYLFCSGDCATVRNLVPGILAVLDWFARHADAKGLPGALPYWNMTDWCPWWPRGVVPGADSGPTVIITSQYIQALREAADILGCLGEDERARELSVRVAGLRAEAHRAFWSEREGLYFDRPGGPEVSQYGNAWAVKAGLAGEGELRAISRRFPGDPKLAPGSFFWWHTGFAALRAMRRYDEMPRWLGPWEEALEAGLSTFAEENSYWRSLCHAWSAHPALECYEGVLGIEPAAPGFRKTRIRPHRCGLEYARGSVCTPNGLISVDWRNENGICRLQGTAPEAIELEIVEPSGRTRAHRGGRFEANFAWN